MRNALKGIKIESDFNPKKYLEQIKKASIMIETKRNQLLEIKGMLIGVNCSKELNLSKNKNVSDKLSKIVCTKIDLIESIKEDIKDYTILKNTIINEIYNIEDVRYMNLLILRYIEYKTLEEISVKMGFTYEYIRHLHQKALNEFKIKHTKLH